MKKFGFGVSAFVVTVTTLAFAQQPKTPPAAPVTQKPMMTANPITDAERKTYDEYKNYLLKAADEMPEKDYAFRPATMPAADKKDIRTFAEVLIHIADENGMFCGLAEGMTAPAPAAGATTKAAVQKALADSFAFCDKAWAGTTDKNAVTAVELPFGLGMSTRLAALSFNSAHNAEHYGNVVTYLRAKGLVPPSSQPAGK
jgi:uncharacterized damage-inducible protein DinB